MLILLLASSALSFVFKVGIFIISTTSLSSETDGAYDSPQSSSFCRYGAADIVIGGNVSFDLGQEGNQLLLLFDRTNPLPSPLDPNPPPKLRLFLPSLPLIV